MKICHISDCHGNIKLPINCEWDVLVCTGDLFPNSYNNNEEQYQHQWLHTSYEINNLKSNLNGRPFIWCSGNHDLIDVANELKKLGFNAYDSTNALITVANHTFYGFPYIMRLNNTTRFECDTNEMKKHVDDAFEFFGNFHGLPDIFLAHAPLVGCYDKAPDGSYHGNALLTLAFDKWLDYSRPPVIYMCGHVHTPGISMSSNLMLISNAATHWHIIEV